MKSLKSDDRARNAEDAASNTPAVDRDLHGLSRATLLPAGSQGQKSPHVGLLVEGVQECGGAGRDVDLALVPEHDLVAERLGESMNV